MPARSAVGSQPVEERVARSSVIVAPRSSREKRPSSAVFTFISANLANSFHCRRKLAASSYRSAAVNGQDGAGDELGIIRGEIDACIGHVDGLRKTAERHGCHKFSPVLGRVG
jgi:hypothetical protein